MKLFKRALQDYFFKVYSDIQIYKYCLGMILVISIWYIQRNRDVYFTEFVFSMADGYIISINCWMNILIIFPITLLTTSRILESRYSVQQVLKGKCFREIWIMQLIECVANAVIVSGVITLVVCIANLDTIRVYEEKSVNTDLL